MILTIKQTSKIIIDDEDYSRVSQYNWRVVIHKKSTDKRRAYIKIVAEVWNKGKRTRLYLHRFVVNAQPKDFVDHINHNVFDCRKSNLRICTVQENNCNRRPAKTNKSGYRGVYYDAKRKKFRCEITKNKIKVHRSCHSTAEEAALTYNIKAKELFGEFAYQNVLQNCS